MFGSIFIFILVQLAILARYIVYGAFEPYTYLFTYLFLVAAVLIYIISKNFSKKEMAYTPHKIDEWSFYNKQKTFSIAKPLYKGDVKRGSIQRYFAKKWHYLVADIVDSPFFLALRIEMDHQIFDIKPIHKKWLSNQSHWMICKNGEEIGSAQTKNTLKNAAKLTEVIEFTFEDATFSSTATTITSTIALQQNEQQVGKMHRNHIISNVNVLEVQDDSPEKIIALILHAYHFKNA